MTITSVLALFKSIIPVLEPLGEQGINSLFDALDAEIATMSDSNDLKVLAKILSPGLRQFAITEIQKIKS